MAQTYKKKGALAPCNAKNEELMLAHLHAPEDLTLGSTLCSCV
jgi:hypothetical protein